MKVITEERLREVLNGDANYKMSAPYINAQRKLLVAMIDQCQELDTLTVTRLRPMSDAPRDGRYIRVYWETGFPGEWCDDFVFWNERFQGWERDWVDPEDEVLQDRNFDGFIDLPRYEPEKV